MTTRAFLRVFFVPETTWKLSSAGGMTKLAAELRTPAEYGVAAGVSVRSKPGWSDALRAPSKWTCMTHGLDKRILRWNLLSFLY